MTISGNGTASRSPVELPSACGVVLAGGESRRMGEDKRVVDVGGRPLLERAVEAAKAVCDDVVITTSPHRPVTDAHGARVVEDLREDGGGPLVGLETGLLAARRPVVLVLAGDHPAASPAVLQELVRHLESSPDVEAVVLGTADGPQPLVGAYRREAHVPVARLLEQGERRVQAVLDATPVEVYEESAWRELDPGGGTAVDLDTPEQLAAWAGTG